MSIKYHWTIETYFVKDEKALQAIKDAPTRLLAAILLKEARDTGVIYADVEWLAERFNTNVGAIYERLEKIEGAGVSQFRGSIGDDHFIEKFRKGMQSASSRPVEKAKAVTLNSKHQENMVNKYDNAGLN